MPGWKPLIVCDGIVKKCDFASLIELVKVLIYDLVLLSTLLAVIVFAYAGLKLLTANGNEGEVKKAITMLQKVAWGYVWILAAWLIVYTITSVLLKDGYSLLGSPITN